MPLTDAQKRAQENYRKKSVKQVAVRFYPADAAADNINYVRLGDSTGETRTRSG